MSDSPPDHLQPGRDRRELRRARQLRLGDNEGHLDRLLADRDLNTRLALAGYAGSEWERFCEVLARYGIGVISAWCATGRIFGECDKVGAVLTRRPIPSSDAEELAIETVANAIRAFRTNVLMKHRWDPERGATLKTFFIGQCKFQFPNIYRRWLRDFDGHRAAARRLKQTTHNHESGEPSIDPLPDLIDAIAQSGVGSTDRELVRQIVFLKYHDYPNQAIAEIAGVSLPTVKSILYQLRKHHRDIA